MRIISNMEMICLKKKLVYCVLISRWIVEDNMCLGCDLCRKRLEKIKKILEENTKKGDL